MQKKACCLEQHRTTHHKCEHTQSQIKSEEAFTSAQEENF